MELPWRQSTTSGGGVIGGQAFYDNDNDGMRDDNNGINGVPNINVWLLSCDPHQTLAHQTTPSNGIYRFVDLARGSYYIIAQPPRQYHFSAGGSVYDVLDSTIDHESGRTICFELKDGEKTMDWSFGLHRPSDRPSIQPSTANSPASIIPSDGQASEAPKSQTSPTLFLSSSPRPSFIPSPGSLRSSVGPSSNPTLSPSPGPLPEPSPGPSPSPSFTPTLSSSEEPSIMTSHSPSHEPSETLTPYPSNAPSSMPSKSATENPSIGSSSLLSSSIPYPSTSLDSNSTTTPATTIAPMMPSSESQISQYNTSRNKVTTSIRGEINLGYQENTREKGDNDGASASTSTSTRTVSNKTVAVSCFVVALAFLGIMVVAFFALGRRRRKGGNNQTFRGGVEDDLESGFSGTSGETTPTPPSSSLFNLVRGRGAMPPSRMSSQFSEEGDKRNHTANAQSVGEEASTQSSAQSSSSNPLSEDGSKRICKHNNTPPVLVPMSRQQQYSPHQHPRSSSSSSSSHSYHTRLEREMASLHVMIQSHQKNSEVRDVPSSNYEVTAEMDRAIIGKVYNSTAAGIYHSQNDESASSSSSSIGSSGSSSTISKTSIKTSSSFGSTCSNTSILLDDERIIPSSRSYSSSDGSMGESRESSYISSTSSDDTLPSVRHNSISETLAKTSLENNETAEEDPSGDGNLQNENKVLETKPMDPPSPIWPKANEGDIQKIQDLEAKLQVLSLSIQSYRNGREQWPNLKSCTERSQRELDLVSYRATIRRPHTSSDISSSNSSLDAERIKARQELRSNTELAKAELDNNSVVEKGSSNGANLDQHDGDKVPPSSSGPLSVRRGFIEDEEVSFTYSNSSEDTSPRLRHHCRQQIRDLVAKSPPPNIAIPNEKYLNHANQSSPPNSVGSTEQDSTHEGPIIISQNLTAPVDNFQLVPREIHTFPSSAILSSSKNDDNTAVDKFSKSKDYEIEANSPQNYLDLKNDHLDEVDDLTGKNKPELAPAPNRAFPAETVAQLELARLNRVFEERNDTRCDKAEEKGMSSESSISPHVRSEEDSRTGPKRVDFCRSTEAEESPNEEAFQLIPNMNYFVRNAVKDDKNAALPVPEMAHVQGMTN